MYSNTNVVGTLFLSDVVARECRARRWLATVGRAGAAKPIARKIGPTGIATIGVDAAKSELIGWARTGRMRFPWRVTRHELRQFVASETHVNEHGVLHWRPVSGVQNHLLDTLVLCLHGRRWRMITARRRRFQMVTA